MHRPKDFHAPDRWHQHNITFIDRDSARHAIDERVGPALITAETAGQLTAWWFMNKQPWPLRYLADEPSPIIESLLSDLVGEGRSCRGCPVSTSPSVRRSAARTP